MGQQLVSGRERSFGLLLLGLVAVLVSASVVWAGVAGAGPSDEDDKSVPPGCSEEPDKCEPATTTTMGVTLTSAPTSTTSSSAPTSTTPSTTIPDGSIPTSTAAPTTTSTTVVSSSTTGVTSTTVAVLGSTTIVTTTLKPTDKPKTDDKTVDSPKVAGVSQTTSSPAPAAGAIPSDRISYAG